MSAVKTVKRRHDPLSVAVKNVPDPLYRDPMSAVKSGGRPRRPVENGSPVPFDVLADPVATAATYTNHLAHTGLADATVRVYSHHVTRFAAWLAEQQHHKSVEVFTDPFSRDFATRDYRAHLSHELSQAGASVDAALGAVDGLFSWVGLGRSTTRRVVTTRGNFQEGDYLDEAERRAVMRAAERRGPRDLAIVGLMRFAGLRIGEVPRVNVDDWWGTERAGQIEVRGKGGKHRKVPLSRDLRPLLHAWQAERRTWPGADSPAFFLSERGTRLATRTVNAMVARVAESSGVSRLHPHLLRHTFARCLIDAGVPLPEVQAYLGHARIDTTMLYTRPTAAQLSAGIERGSEQW